MYVTLVRIGKGKPGLTIITLRKFALKKIQKHILLECVFSFVAKCRSQRFNIFNTSALIDHRYNTSFFIWHYNLKVLKKQIVFNICLSLEIILNLLLAKV